MGTSSDENIGHQTIDLSAYADVTSIYVWDIVDHHGLWWDDFSFDLPPALLAATLTQYGNSSNSVTALTDAAIGQLYLAADANDAAHVDLSAAFTPEMFGSTATASRIRVIAAPDGHPESPIINNLTYDYLQTHSGLSNILLDGTSGANKFDFTVYYDANGNDDYDDGEPKRQINVHVCSINLETDSNNDGTIDPETDGPVKNGPNVVGKRIFVDIDDDNKNGMPDLFDGPADYAAAPDDDFAEIDLLEGATLPAGVEVRLWEQGGLILYADDAKTALTAVSVENGAGPGQWKWIAGAGAAIYAEGTAAGRCTVSWCLYDPAKGVKIGNDQSLVISVETMVYPFANQDAGWSQLNTSQWKGLNVGPAWGMSKPLIDYILHPDVLGTLETRRPDLPNNVASPGQFNPEKDSISTNVSYANGFTMEFDYSFQKDHADQDNQDNAKTGYVQAGLPLLKTGRR